MDYQEFCKRIQGACDMPPVAVEKALRQQQEKLRIERMLQKIPHMRWANMTDIVFVFGSEDVAEKRLQRLLERGKVSKLSFHIEGEQLTMYAMSPEIQEAMDRMFADMTPENVSALRKLISED